jgi:hypothetical protein
MFRIVADLQDTTGALRQEFLSSIEPLPFSDRSAPEFKSNPSICFDRYKALLAKYNY